MVDNGRPQSTDEKMSPRLKFGSDLDLGLGEPSPRNINESFFSPKSSTIQFR